MYKILSLDGGGSWTIFQLLTLQDKYGDVNGHQILREYDLVIANSGGSIVLAALAENLKISQAMNLFKMKRIRESIFKRNTFKDRFFPVDYLRAFGIPFGPKYSVSQKMLAFANLFKNVNKYQMSDLPAIIGKENLKIAICTYDAMNNRAKFFKSYGSNNSDYDSIRLTQAINGSSNAPVQYFDFPARFKAKQSEIYYELWDGALGGFNNPILAGIIEAYKEGIKLKDIQIISIGTGNKLMSHKEKEDYWELKQETILKRRKKFAIRSFRLQLSYYKEIVMNQAKTILYNPPDWANYVAMMFLSTSGTNESISQIIRLSPLIHYDSNMDISVKPLIEDLYSLDMDLTSNSDINLLIKCFKEWKNGRIRNHPIEFKIERNNDLTFISGDKTYSEAFARW